MVINNNMKIKDILNEDATCSVARYYKEASADSERFYNPEVVKYQEKNSKYYDEFFEQWFKNDVVPVFTKPVTKAQPEYNTIPQGSKLQSPGFRGLQYALAAAGLPYNHNVQEYKPDPNRMLASQTMDTSKGTA